MQSRIPFIVSLSVLTAALLAVGSGCAWSVGGGKTTTSGCSEKPTLGQELIDLKKARDQGAISEEEYQKLRQQEMQR